MSTKIYSGYILDEGMNPFEMITVLKTEFTIPIKKRICEVYFRNFFRLYDLLTYNEGEISHLLDEKAASSGHYLPKKIDVPFVSLLARDEVNKEVEDEKYNYQVEILFAQDPETKRYLAYFMGNRETEKQFENMKGVSEYCYYNNSDEPEDISADDWAERGRAWDRTVNLDDHMTNSMLSLEVLSTFDRSCHLSIPEMLKLNPAFPDREWRIGMVVNRLLIEGYFKDNPDADKDYAGIRKAQSNTAESNRLWTLVDKNLGEDITPEILHQKIQDSFKLQ